MDNRGIEKHTEEIYRKMKMINTMEKQKEEMVKMKDNWLEYCEKCKDKIKMLLDSTHGIIGVQCDVMLNNPYHNGNIYEEEDIPLKCGKMIELEITEKYMAIVGKTIENVKIQNINKDKNHPFFELEFTDGSKFSIKSKVSGEYSTEYISGDEE